MTHVAVARATDFIITGSADGHVKLWKKMSTGIEFVKHFVAHLGKLHAMEVTPDGMRLVTSASDRMIKFFEIQSFDMSNMILTERNASDEHTGFMPGVCCWLLEGASRVYSRVAVADKNSSVLRIYRMEDRGTEFVELSVHLAPVLCLALNVTRGVVVSVDGKGVIEYWDSESLEMPSKKRGVLFSRKMDTDLYDLAKVCTLFGS